MSSVSFFREYLQWADAAQHTHWLGWYGAETAKPIKTWTTASFTLLESRRVQKEVTLVQSKKVAGRWTICGKHKALSLSEHYPRAFGEALVAAMQNSPA